MEATSRDRRVSRMEATTDSRVIASQDLQPVRAFAQLSHADVAYAGGKGANLGELTAAGFPVPPGFVVGAPSYAAFCDGGALRERVTDRLRDLDVDDTEALTEATAEVRKMVDSEPIPA